MSAAEDYTLMSVPSQKKANTETNKPGDIYKRRIVISDNDDVSYFVSVDSGDRWLECNSEQLYSQNTEIKQQITQKKRKNT